MIFSKKTKFTCFHRQILIAVCILFLHSYAHAQHLKTNSRTNNKNQISTAKVSEVKTSTCTGLSIPTSENSFMLSINRMGGALKLSSDVIELKKSKTKNRSVSSSSSKIDARTTKSNKVPVVTKSFEGNLFNGGAPPDNSLAISNGGLIVSAVNANVIVYNTTGSLLWFGSFWDIFKNPALTEIIYDPIVMYDSEADRFVFIAIHGFSSVKSKVLVAFSKSNNPVEGWYTYELSGNPFNNNCWLDYPKLGISNNEIFITGNLFNDFTGFNEAVIFQITKNKGYVGQTLEWVTWSDIPGTVSTIIPASYGQDGNYGPGLFCVTQTPGRGNEVTLLEITNEINANPQLLADEINKFDYGPGGFAQQAGTDVQLITGDCRILNAFYLNGVVHYVFQSDFSSTNFTGINYNRLNVTTLVNTSFSFGQTGFDFAFPSIASYAINENDPTVAVCFLSSSATIFPETRVVICDENGNWSDDVLIKKGNNFVDAFAFEGFVRWGDYSGIAYRKNNAIPEVWLSGCYGSTQTLFSVNYKCFETWIAQLSDTPLNAEQEFEANSAVVYPNPVVDFYSVDFTLSNKEKVSITLTDVAGNPVKTLFNGDLKAGKNLLTFNKNALSSGLYVLKISTQTKVVHTAKLIVN